MKERLISQKFVIEDIENPDKVEKSSFHPSRFLIKKIYFNQKLQRVHLLMIISEAKENLVKLLSILLKLANISKFYETSNKVR